MTRRVIEAATPACAAAAPELGWSLWQGRLDEYPVSSLLALEAVQAARRQSEAAAEELDLALRTALFAKSRCITLRHEILAAARSCPFLDPDQLAVDLDAGVSRAAVMRQARAARDGAAHCSGSVVMPDGVGYCNPGIDVRWLRPSMPRGVAVVGKDDPTAFRNLVRPSRRSCRGERAAHVLR